MTTQEARLAELVNALEARVLSDPAILGSMVGMALGYIVDGARKDPAGTLGDMDRLGRAVGEACTFVLDGAPVGSQLAAMLPELVTIDGRAS